MPELFLTVSIKPISENEWFTWEKGDGIRPFTFSGVDFARPLLIKESRRRGNIPTDIPISHYSFVLTLKLYIWSWSRIWPPKRLWQLFVASRAKEESTRLCFWTMVLTLWIPLESWRNYEFLKDKEDVICTQLVKQKIEWSFIPPRAPNFGGRWESAVKRHFYAVSRTRSHIRGVLHSSCRNRSS